MQINLVVAIDFTASNGDPLSLDSLHYSRYHIPYTLCFIGCVNKFSAAECVIDYQM